MEDKRIEILKMIADDMKDDAKNFDGKPFNGKTVAEYFGNQGAAIAALANIIQSVLEEFKPIEDAFMLKK
jgi:hypothetical protein